MSLTFDLKINGVQESDAGFYTCAASNINGEASNSTYVTVVGKSSSPCGFLPLHIIHKTSVKGTANLRYNDNSLARFRHNFLSEQIKMSN